MVTAATAAAAADLRGSGVLSGNVENLLSLSGVGDAPLKNTFNSLGGLATRSTVASDW
jgi:hypothetical protein